MQQEMKLQDEVKEVSKKGEFVPLWMPVLAFLLIVASYIYLDVTGIYVNKYFEVGAIGISGLFAIACAYLKLK